MRTFLLTSLPIAAIAAAAFTLVAQAPAQGTAQNITINYPAKAPANWPLFLAKEGGYYQKYGVNATMVFRSAGHELSHGAGHAGGFSRRIPGDHGEPYEPRPVRHDDKE
jgi:ABC-type nitrate/sulfonate/bicarbonate transport system substrate-binding protein